MSLAHNGFKRCSSCKKKYSLKRKAFSRNRVTQDGLQNVCTPCKSKLTRAWRHATTSGAIERMFESQKGLCAVCRRTGPLVLDHDHKTERRRQLLCRLCNALLGMCDDNITIMKRAITYVTKHRVLSKSKLPNTRNRIA